MNCGELLRKLFESAEALARDRLTAGNMEDRPLRSRLRELNDWLKDD